MTSLSRSHSREVEIQRQTTAVEKKRGLDTSNDLSSLGIQLRSVSLVRLFLALSEGKS